MPAMDGAAVDSADGCGNRLDAALGSCVVAGMGLSVGAVLGSSDDADDGTADA